MSSTHTATRQHKYLAAMVAFEQAIARHVEALAACAADTADVAALLENVQALSTNHRHALVERLSSVAPEVPIPDVPSSSSVLDALLQVEEYPASTALLSLYTLLDQAVIVYSVLLELCRRAADSSVRGTSNTADVAYAGVLDYTAAVQKIARMLHYMVVGELEQEGQECQCTCPSCGLGICLCPTASRRDLGIAWEDARSIYVPGPIVMVKPRAGSTAAGAGLQKGDLVLAVDNKEIGTLPMLQDAVRSHPSGDEVHFHVRREAGEDAAVALVRP